MTDRINGHCGCGSVKYELNGAVKCVANCHCTICRKLTGGAFATYVVVSKEDYNLLEGKNHIGVWNKPNTTIEKHFCTLCGSPLFNSNPKYGPVNIVYAGTLAEGHPLAPTMNIYCDNKLHWLETLFAIENRIQG